MNEQLPVTDRKIYKYPFPILLKFTPRFMLFISSLSFIMAIYFLVTNFSTRLIAESLVTFGSVLISLYSCVYWSDIETHPEGIKVDFLGWDINISWNDVLKIGEVKNIMGFEIWYVKVKKLNFAYKLLGLANIGSFVPIILFTHILKNRKELIQEIRRRKPDHHDHSS